MGHAADAGDNNAPGPTLAYAKSNNGQAYTAAGASNGQMNLQYLGISGGSLPHNNMMPYLTLSFCIALQGVFPPRP
jgi:microcystin-dependent protein